MIRDIVTAILSALAVIAVALGTAGAAHAAHTTPGTPAPAYAACTIEDGSDPGQAFPCYWDATTRGNGQGTSYVLIAPVCTEAQVAASDAAHRAGLPDPLGSTCDDLESLIG
jgi:hypothetical protein